MVGIARSPGKAECTSCDYRYNLRRSGSVPRCPRCGSKGRKVRKAKSGRKVDCPDCGTTVETTVVAGNEVVEKHRRPEVGADFRACPGSAKEVAHI